MKTKSLWTYAAYDVGYTTELRLSRMMERVTKQAITHNEITITIKIHDMKIDSNIFFASSMVWYGRYSRVDSDVKRSLTAAISACTMFKVTLVRFELCLPITGTFSWLSCVRFCLVSLVVEPVSRTTFVCFSSRDDFFYSLLCCADFWVGDPSGWFDDSLFSGPVSTDSSSCLRFQCFLLDLFSFDWFFDVVSWDSTANAESRHHDWLSVEVLLIDRRSSSALLARFICIVILKLMLISLCTQVIYRC